MMKFFRPSLSHHCRRASVRQILTPTTGIRDPPLEGSTGSTGHLRLLHQRAGSKVAYTVSGTRNSSTTTSACTPSRRTPALDGRTSRTLPVRRAASDVKPTLTLHHALRSRASYSTEATVAGQPNIHHLFEPKTGTFQYIVVDPSTLAAAIIDPVLDYDPATQEITTRTADSLLSLIKEKGYKVDKILETHAHADHLTASAYLQSRLAQEQGHKRPPICIGKRIGQVQKRFGERYEVPAQEYEGVFDKLFDDDEKFNIGELEAMAIHLPGHTPDHLGYKIGDNVFCGDSIFHVDIGTARADFPGGSSSSLFYSARKLLALPDHVKIWTGHDYPPEGRDAPVPWMTVQQHKEQNKHLKAGVTEDDFVALRQARDAQLAAPKLLHQSLQINIRGGRLPKPSATGYRLLRLPLQLKGIEW